MKPLLILDCDEVILEFAGPFARWLHDARGVELRFDSFALAGNMRHLADGRLVRSVADGNIGSIFGWGFAPFHGGALQFINAMGAARFVARSGELAKLYGARFAPAAIVIKQAAEGTRFEDAA